MNKKRSAAKSEESERFGATTEPPAAQSSAHGLLGKEVGPSEDMLDLFLDEENLIRLAMGHLGGRLPPRRMGNASGVHPKTAAERKQQGSQGLANLGAQPARERKVLAAKLQRELQARSWTAQDLAEYANLSVPDCRALLNGSGFFTQEIASKLASCLATSELYWMSGTND